MSDTVLDPSLIKDLSNHIYEKRKATAFQIEGLTKQAVQRDDIQSVHKIIEELTELTHGGSNSAKMGAITALGSVSVALGSFAIAYFLEQIITPIFATFKDTDARVRYYACESLYNIAKIARGEILLYFNEVFDVLCILVTDTESSVKNAADILDRLIKDIVSAKSTNYVSILHQQHSQEITSHLPNTEGVEVQVNQVQDAKKAFSLPKFIPTLLERMYTIDPFAKKFLIGWLELFDGIPSLELITFLPNFLEPLIKFLLNGSPSDVRIETQNLLNEFLKEIKQISNVKYEIKKQQLLQHATKANEPVEQLASEVDEKLSPDNASVRSDLTTVIHRDENDEAVESDSDAGLLFLSGQDIYIDFPRLIDILLSFLRIPNETDSKSNDLSSETHDVYIEIQMTVLKWLQEILVISPASFVRFLPDCVSTTMKSISITDSNRDIDLRNQFVSLNLSVQDFIISLNESGERRLHSLDPAEIDDFEVKGINKEVYDEFIEVYLNRTLRGILTECLRGSNEFARITSLDWLIFLYSKNPTSFFKALNDDEEEPFDLTSLLRSSTESSNDVVLKVLQLLSQISESNDDFFKSFIVKLVRFFETDGMDAEKRSLSRNKIEFIIRKLCVTLSSVKIYRSISEVLATYDNKLEFLSTMVITLNNILLTSHELAGFRKALKNLDHHKTDDWLLFLALFQSWCHSAPAALSLCLLTSNYELAYLIIKTLAESEVTFQLLTQLDILVQLLETPIFLKLRLQLLEPEKHPHLYKTLYGILMILPQSSTFNTLKNRLSSLAHVHVPGGNLNPTGTTPVTTPGPSTTATPNLLSIRRKRNYELLDKFTKVQEKHEHHTAERRKDGFLHEDRFKESRPDRLASINSLALDDKKKETRGFR